MATLPKNRNIKTWHRNKLYPYKSLGTDLKNGVEVIITKKYTELTFLETILQTKKAAENSVSVGLITDINRVKLKLLVFYKVNDKCKTKQEANIPIYG